MAKNPTPAEGAMVPVTERFMALVGGGNNTALAVIRENLGTEALTARDLELIKVPTGGQLFFTVGEEPVKQLTGVILSSQAQRARWIVPFEESGGGSAPDCYSPDQIQGYGDPGGDCLTCPYAQQGSDPKGGNGQACNAFRTVVLLAPDSPLPYVVKVPRTSLKNFRDYLVKELGKKNLRSSQVETEFTLETDKSDGGIVYSKIKPRMLRPLTPSEVTAVAAYAEAIMPHLQRAQKDIGQQQQQGSGI